MKGILLINLGTPDLPSPSAVGRYLRQFLGDPRVIDVHPMIRVLLANLITPFRSSRSATAYQKIWTDTGSPLLVHTKRLEGKVSEKLGEGYAVEIGMRYGSPSIESAIGRLIQKGVTEIRVLPLFPQYASSSTGSAISEFFRVVRGLWSIPPITILPPFYNHPGFVEGFEAVGRPVLERFKPDHILFSFHGLPERHMAKGDPYLFQCYETAQLLAEKLKIPSEIGSVSFQSRLGPTPWIKPWTDQVVIDLAKKKKKRIAVFCPSFVVDCLETLEEIGIRARESALTHGIQALELIPSLNTHPQWVETVCKMVSV